jgi:hypothetical protein
MAMSSPGSSPTAFKIYWELVVCLGWSCGLTFPLLGRMCPQGMVTEGFAVVIPMLPAEPARVAIELSC